MSVDEFVALVKNEVDTKENNSEIFSEDADVRRIHSV